MTCVAVVGATGAVGQEMLAVLAERKFPVGELRLFGSQRSAGRRIGFAGAEHEIRTLGPGAFDGCDLAFFSAGAGLAREQAPIARAAGALVVDNSSAFRMDPDCPLVVPELNGDEIEGAGVVANPNCSTILLAMALAPLQRLAGVRRAVVCSYQAVSGAGARALAELHAQEEAERNGQEPRPEVLPVPIAHNVIPWVGGAADAGYSEEETKVLHEARRILQQPELDISATCVRVPVLRAHAEAIHVELEHPLEPSAAIAAYEEAPGVRVWGEGFPTPRAVAGGDDVWVGRVRTDRAFQPGLALWCVMDQLRKGAALNAIQIAERALAQRA